ncbi:hypothetical protein RWH44_12260 [Microbacterium sp. KSW2-29]|uniref:Response receiver domain-containing protein n=1 Tax=Microbacterium phycohabitans TaxID=3075993 RepID=A0ABU3SQ36_9MICO|nr:hypothetical protein [Microbacterium sp. KSW2-29]MDU0346470.1 hypothetical protein [Microbacterium sp. KSW2-29]
MSTGVLSADSAPSPEVRNAISELLQQLKITRLLVIDDDLDAEADQQNLIDVKVGYLDVRAELSAAAAIHGIDELVEDSRDSSLGDEIRDDIDSLWQDLDNTEKLSIIRALPAPDDTPRNLATLDAIKPYLPRRVEYIPLSVAEWRAQRDTLLSEGHPGTLIFFDRNLSRANAGPTGGDDFIRELHETERSGVYCGILTQDARGPEAEVKVSEELRSKIKKAIPAIGKDRVRAPQDFVEGLRFFLHVTELARVKEHTNGALAEAFRETQDFLEGIGYYVILASAASAYDEGVFEGDGLLRLARSYFRRRTEKHLAHNPPTSEMERLRRAAARTISDVLPRSSDTRALEWGERFDDTADLIAAKSATEVGDIYELTGRDGRTGHAILLAQSCDLMVRKNGERAHAPTAFTLAMLEEEPRITDGSAARLFPVGTLRPETKARLFANLARRIYLPPQVLDACVLSTDGSSKINKSLANPHALSAGWAKIPKKLRDWTASRVKTAEASIVLLPAKDQFAERAQVAERLYEAAFGQLFVDGTISLQVTADTGAVTFGVRRVSRLVEAHAKALLVQLSQYQSRPDTPAEIMRHTMPPGSVQAAPEYVI